ncbi:hypothetical protein [Streptomyces sp. NPDC057939]|uniref:hypothetical protein n=1 Tax=Streptomyces sp. NPDC057939 TaxID=3346284 RepID=UPI0036EE033E
MTEAPPSPEVLADKPVRLVGPERVLFGRLLCLLTGSEFTVRVSYAERVFESSSTTAFGALTDVRRLLRAEGLRPAVEGARLDVYPSRMALEMGGGRRSYRRPPEGRPYTVDTFDDVAEEDDEKLSSVAEQRAWIAERVRLRP